MSCNWISPKTRYFHNFDRAFQAADSEFKGGQSDHLPAHMTGVPRRLSSHMPLPRNDVSSFAPCLRR
jgi:hypothetical protein